MCLVKLIGVHLHKLGLINTSPQHSLAMVTQYLTSANSDNVTSYAQYYVF
jgi:hypothetical protein